MKSKLAWRELLDTMLRSGGAVLLACFLACGAGVVGAQEGSPSPVERSGESRSQWVSEIVDSVPHAIIGKYSSMTVDFRGDIHIVYFNETRGTLRYSYRGKQDTKWYSMELGPGGPIASIATDAQGRPHVAYLGANGSGLRYASWDGKKWQGQVVDPQRIEFFLSLQMDSNDHPKISYYHRLYPDGSYALHLKYAYFDGHVWYTQTADQRFGTGKFNSLALDQAGNPHIAYSDFDAFSLRYAHSDGAHWAYGSPDTAQLSNGTVGSGTSIAVDNAGNPHIAYFDGNHKALKYVRKSSGAWDMEVVDHVMDGAGNIDRVSLQLDSQGRPHIAFFDSGLGAVKYASRTGAGWQTEVVDSSHAGMYVSLCFAGQDIPYISYFDQAAGVLRVARRQGISVGLPQAASPGISVVKK